MCTGTPDVSASVAALCLKMWRLPVGILGLKSANECDPDEHWKFVFGEGRWSPTSQDEKDQDQMDREIREIAEKAEAKEAKAARLARPVHVRRFTV
jgi:hypothetical protein